MSTDLLAKIEGAQKIWGDGLIAIGQAYVDGQDYRKLAAELVDQCYGYDHDDGVVLFKPTRAHDHPFRQTKESAISYFVGGNDQFAEDHGFALQPWSAVKFVNDRVFCQSDMALCMGHYFFTSDSGISQVEYSFGYVVDSTGQLRIILHHSSMPYQPA